METTIESASRNKLNNTKGVSQSSSSNLASIFFLLGSLIVYINPPNTISFRDLTFCVVYPIYIWLANTICFHQQRKTLSTPSSSSLSSTPSEEALSLGKGEFLGKPAFTRYVIMFNIFTVLIPYTLIVYHVLSASSSQSDNMKGIEAAVAPTVLLFAQVFMEVMTRIGYHDVLRILVPIGFNSFRLISLYEWVEISYNEYNSSDGNGNNGVLALAILNFLMWMYNLFIFLILRVLPVYFDKKDTPYIKMKYTMIPIPADDCQKKQK